MPPPQVSKPAWNVLCNDYILKRSLENLLMYQLLAFWHLKTSRGKSDWKNSLHFLNSPFPLLDTHRRKAQDTRTCIALRLNANISCSHQIRTENFEHEVVLRGCYSRTRKIEHYHLTATGLHPIQWHLANANNLVGLLRAFETKRQLSTLVLDPSALDRKKSQSYCLNLKPESHT